MLRFMMTNGFGELEPIGVKNLEASIGKKGMWTIENDGNMIEHDREMMNILETMSF